MIAQLTGVPRRRPLRWLLALAMIAASISFAFAVVDMSSRPYEAARHDYEAKLLHAPSRIDGDFGAYIATDGTVYTAYLSPLGCRLRCMTAQKVVGGYAVTLPVSYSYSPGSQDFMAAFVKNVVVSLTYWDSTAHVARTITSRDGASVKLPSVLYDRSVASVTLGETVYVTPDFIRKTDEGVVVLKDVDVRSEPGGAYYGFVDFAKLTRTKTGFTACLPQGYGSLIDDRKAVGVSVSVSSERC